MNLINIIKNKLLMIIITTYNKRYNCIHYLPHLIILLYYYIRNIQTIPFKRLNKKQQSF